MLESYGLNLSVQLVTTSEQDFCFWRFYSLAWNESTQIQASSLKQLLLGSLVDLFEKGTEDIATKALRLGEVVDERVDLLVRLGLVLLETGAKVDVGLVENILDALLTFWVLLAIVIVEDLTLLRGSVLKGNVDVPGALVVENVGADLANLLRGTITVEEVVLNLEVLAHGEENVEGLLVEGFVGDTGHAHGEGDGEVERVEGSLVDDDEVVLLQRELGEVDRVFGGSDEVNELAELGLEGDVVEEFEEHAVIRFGAEVLLEQKVDGGFQHEGVVDGNVADTVDAVPARLTSASDAGIHHVIGDEEVGLEKLDAPAEDGGLEVFGLGELTRELTSGSIGAKEDLDGVNDGKTAVELATGSVVVEVATEPVDGLGRHVFRDKVSGKLLYQEGEDGLEAFALLDLELGIVGQGLSVYVGSGHV